MNTIYKNQKIIQIIDYRNCKIKTDVVINIEYMFKIMRELSPNELKIILYLYSIVDDFVALSPLDISNKTGASRPAIQQSIRVLIKKGYLKLKDDNCYIFEKY